MENGDGEGDGEDSGRAPSQGEAVLGGSSGEAAVEAGAVIQGKGSRRGCKDGRGRRVLAAAGQDEQ